ncbi:hypothetical protein C2857_005738 [Epichloe festucae Fl1]|uniref:Ras modification protein ERF4 n=1 Tax=Epichloe festucae (strain Fl1) TaxID=877507 RepID=A0A7S9KSY1_EPIFF|nr:hypothetical protein C2857_005738 [Epichloe festucae Fl1]
MSPAFWPFWRQKRQHASPSPTAPTSSQTGTSAITVDPDPDPDPSTAPEHGRLDGSASLVFSTTPNASEPSQSRRIETAVAAGTQGHQTHHTAGLTQSPFRSRKRANQVAAYRSGRPSASRLWNPTNSTPRIPDQQRHRKRRPSTPPLPTVPLHHPVLDTSLAGTKDPQELAATATAAGSYPLLTLSEQRQTRHSASARASLQIERFGASHRRISLPRSFRDSHDGQPSLHRTSIALDATQTTPGSSSWTDEVELAELSAKSKGKQRAPMATTMATTNSEDATRSYSRDLERGPGVMMPRMSNAFAADGIGSDVSSSNSSIMGEDVQPDAGEEWGPQHPCYPHLNPHVPVDSMEYATTRIIRVKRDWLIAGDLAPTFSNLYPEILDPAGVSEQEFRRIVDKLNGELIPVFDPFSFRNMLDSVLGLVTGWLWDDFGLTAAKSRLNNLEKWIERWNQEMEKTMASEEGVVPPKLISLRQTGYLNLDIQIPDPEIAPAPSSIGAGESRTALPTEPMPAIPA